MIGKFGTREPDSLAAGRKIHAEKLRHSWKVSRISFTRTNNALHVKIENEDADKAANCQRAMEN